MEAIERNLKKGNPRAFTREKAKPAESKGGDSQRTPRKKPPLYAAGRSAPANPTKKITKPVDNTPDPVEHSDTNVPPSKRGVFDDVWERVFG